MLLEDILYFVGEYSFIIIYLVPVLLVFFFTDIIRRRRTQKHMGVLEENVKAGLTEPVSLHPVIDRNLCIGCSSCVRACPEKNVLGLIGDKGVLINPTHCIGHGACAKACPVDAISLVFGTEKRGLDIPIVDESFETNVPGIFIAGELGGMGLIRNAVEQGRQAMESVEKKPGLGDQSVDFDVVIVGAGPAGISATLGAIKGKLRYLTIEQEELGGTIAHYPRGKIVMTQAAELPLLGKFNLGETSKETLMQLWQNIEGKTGMRVSYKEKMESVTKNGSGFVIKTNKGMRKTKNILLAIGRRGTPRKLGVPGEDLPKVVYRLVDAEQYRNQHVLVVGGGDSALEAATSIADEPGTSVTLSYRSGAFTRAKEKNRQKVEAARAAGKLQVMFKSNVKEIFPDRVIMEYNGTDQEIKNDAVIVSAGGVLPTGMLKEMGINVETKYGTA